MENTTLILSLGFLFTVTAAVCAAYISASRRCVGTVVAGWFLLNLCLPLLGLVVLDVFTDDHS